MRRNRNGLGDGDGIGRDAPGMVRGFHVLKVKSAAESFEGVIISLSEKLEGFVQFSGFLFQFVHDDVPREHHNMQTAIHLV